jgi:hypothetical protein
MTRYIVLCVRWRVSRCVNNRSRRWRQLRQAGMLTTGAAPACMLQPVSTAGCWQLSCSLTKFGWHWLTREVKRIWLSHSGIGLTAVTCGGPPMRTRQQRLRWNRSIVNAQHQAQPSSRSTSTWNSDQGVKTMFASLQSQQPARSPAVCFLSLSAMLWWPTQ